MSNEKARWSASLEGTAAPFSMMSVDAPNVVIDTVKAAEDGSGDVIVRLYESKHAACDAQLSIHLPVASVAVCDMLENPVETLGVEDGRVALSFRGFEIRTLRMTRA